MFISTGVSLLGAQPSGATLWTPADVTTTAWYDASDASTVTLSGTDVTAWADKSGNGYTATQTGSFNPTYATALVNGLNSIEFGVDGSGARGYGFLDQQALGSAICGVKYAIIGHHARYNSQTQNQVVGAVSGGSVGNTNGVIHLGYDNSTRLRLGQFGNDLDDTIPAYSTTQDAVITGLNRVGGKLVSLNGGEYINTNTNTTDLKVGGNSGFALGRFSGNYYNFAGRINELVFFNFEVLDALYQKVEGYLAWKWGTNTLLPVTHPYYSAAPTV